MSSSIINSKINNINDVRHLLTSINWDFYDKACLNSNELRPFNIRKYHWYPATFIPEIPFTLIEILTKPNAIIYDPFSGIGTTYLQALILNRIPLVTEINKVAVSQTRSLCTLFDPKIDFANIKFSVMNACVKYNASIDYSLNLPSRINTEALRPWYSPKTFNQLCYLFITEENCNDEIIKSAMQIIISGMLITISNQHRGWGYIADNVLPQEKQKKEKRVIDIFYKNFVELTNEISSHISCILKYNPTFTNDHLLNKSIFNEDAKTCNSIDDNSVDMILTSPPYPNMADYVKSQRLSYYYMGYGINNDLSLEIGARKRRNSKDSLENYLSDMIEVNKNISRKLKREGYLCYVMPSFESNSTTNTLRKQIIDKVILNLEDYNLKKEVEIFRLIPTIKRSHNLKWSNLESEKIYIFRKV